METGQVEDLAVWILGQVISAESSRGTETGNHSSSSFPLEIMKN